MVAGRREKLFQVGGYNDGPRLAPNVHWNDVAWDNAFEPSDQSAAAQRFLQHPRCRSFRINLHSRYVDTQRNRAQNAAPAPMLVCTPTDEPCGFVGVGNRPSMEFLGLLRCCSCW